MVFRFYSLELEEKCTLFVITYYRRYIKIKFFTLTSFRVINFYFMVYSVFIINKRILFLAQREDERDGASSWGLRSRGSLRWPVGECSRPPLCSASSPLSPLWLLSLCQVGNSICNFCLIFLILAQVLHSICLHSTGLLV